MIQQAWLEAALLRRPVGNRCQPVSRSAPRYGYNDHMTRRWFCLAASLLVCTTVFVAAQSSGPLDAWLAGQVARLEETYRHLHTHPELSYMEAGTAAYVSDELKRLGYEVHSGVGKYALAGLTGHGVVAVLRNGQGPTVLVRTDLDGLPVEEQTGLPFASKATQANHRGEPSPVMHACGHDLHMTCFLGSAAALAAIKDQWSGTLLMVAQPAEETGAGAKALLDDGLYSRFPKPQYAIALHADATLESGKLGYCPGFALASVDSINITVRGQGGHGAYPHDAKDPIVLAAQLVLALQTIVSREVSPLDSAVVTVGSIHGGSKHNIIPDAVRLQLTVRSYREETRKRILESIHRISRGVALAAGMPEDRMPVIESDDQPTPATYNDPDLIDKLLPRLIQQLGASNVLKHEPVMGGEDFSWYRKAALEADRPTVSTVLFWLGSVAPEKMSKHRSEGLALPALHSSQFAPDVAPAIPAGIKTIVGSVLELMPRK